jgi:hypothetical protein
LDVERFMNWSRSKDAKDGDGRYALEMAADRRGGC